MAWELNGVRIDNDPRKLPAILFRAFPDLKFRSVEALQELYHGVMSLSLEMAKLEQRNRKGEQRAVITRYINQINRNKCRIPSNHEKLLKMLYEKVLISEGLGCLHGFGFENKWEDKLKENSAYEFVKSRTYFKQDLQQKRMEECIMKRSELVKAAKELNETLGLDPQINTKEKLKALISLIKEAAELIDPELDDLTLSTLSVIARITKVEDKEEVIEEKEEFKESKEAVEIMKDVEKKENVKTKKGLFIEELKKGAKTMAEIKKASWNISGSSFYNAFNALVKAGKAKKENGKMIWIGE